MNNISDVLLLAYEHVYDPYSDDAGERFMCHAIFQVGAPEDLAEEAKAAVEEDMRREILESIKAGVATERDLNKFDRNEGALALFDVLSRCDKPRTGEDLRAWHMDLITRLKEQGK